MAIKCKRSENTLAFPALKRNAPNVPKIDLESLDINKPGGSKQKPGATTESVNISFLTNRKINNLFFKNNYRSLYSLQQ